MIEKQGVGVIKCPQIALHLLKERGIVDLLTRTRNITRKIARNKSLEKKEDIATEVYRKNRDVVTRQIMGETILLRIGHLNSPPQACTLNRTSTFVWELIDGQRSNIEIMSLMVSKFDVSEESVRRDIWRVLSELERLCLIERVQ